MRVGRRRVALAGAAGNVLEWYDFGLYGLLAPVLASLFFPTGDRVTALLAVYGILAAGFAVRPLGAWLLGRWGDRRGRRFLLLLSVTLMGASTLAIGVLPTYAAVGIWAPVLMVAVRLLQGFSVGGEFVGSVTYLVETAAPGRRGLAGSIANLGSTGGMLLAAGAAAWAATWAGPARLEAWVWRIPFLAGGVLALAAFYARAGLPESAPREKPPERAERPAQPLRLALRHAPRAMLLVTLFSAGYGVADYLTMVFLPTYAQHWGHLPQALVLRANTAGQAIALAVVPLAGWLSDRAIRRRTLLALVFFLEAVLAWSGFSLALQGPGGLWFAQLSFAALFAVMMGSAPAMLAEQFGAGYRVSGHAVAFNAGMGIAGGTAPLVAVALVRAFGAHMVSPYLIGAALLAAVCVLLLPDRSRAALLP